MTPKRPSQVSIASNNGDIGGGEVMLLRLAETARDLGLSVRVVAPEQPGTLLADAEARGFDVVGIAGRDRKTYMVNLAIWDRRHRRDLLWCNGLVPGLATAGRPGRVLHLHKPPDGRQRDAVRIARLRTRLVLVPSLFLQQRVPGSTVLGNWTDDIDATPRRSLGDPVLIGFIGRYAPEKGLAVLGRALATLEAERRGTFRLLIAGEARFVTDDERRYVDEALRPIEHLVDRLGWIDPDTFFAGVDLAAFPSVAEESFGLVAAEAMAARVPFVISDQEALREVTGPGYPWVARVGDDVDLARTIQALTQHTELRDQHVRDGRRRWEQCYSPAAGRRAYAAVLLDLDLPLDTSGLETEVGT